MTLKKSFESLRRDLAIEHKNSKGVKRGPPSDHDYWWADIAINNMPVSMLLKELINRE